MKGLIYTNVEVINSSQVKYRVSVFETASKC